MATLRELKGRIGSVGSSEKITGAMKMISSAKMHRAESEFRRLLPFRNQIESIIANLLSADATFSSPLTEEVPVSKIAIVVLGSDDGLCGAYNINIFKFLKQHISELRATYGDNADITIVPVGRKMVKAVAKLADEHTQVAPDADVNSKSDGQALNDFNKRIVEAFVSHEFNKVDVAYMNFLSLSRQKPRADQLLPISAAALSEYKKAGSARPYIFEPSPDVIFKTVMPMYVLSTVQEVFAENRVSEQAARVMAMQSANDNAKKLLEQLQLEYNKLRQQSITNELLDIVGGQARD